MKRKNPSKIKNVSYIEFYDVFDNFTKSQQDKIMKQFNFYRVWGLYLIPVQTVLDISEQVFSSELLDKIIFKLSKLDSKFHINFGI